LPICSRKLEGCKWIALSAASGYSVAPEGKGRAEFTVYVLEKIGDEIMSEMSAEEIEVLKTTLLRI
ncbi:MAG: hypothetical protein PQJ61_14640, partial [Spirochaetales bacterium]|nr:hypothetical protein [Spirochaetales bacterium]